MICRPAMPLCRLLAVALMACSIPARAQGPFQDTETLDRAVAAFTGRPIGADGGARTPVDARLKLASCATLALAWRQDNHDAVVITCTAPEWRIFVPVQMPPPPPPAPTPAVAVAAPAAKPEIVIKRGDPVTVEVKTAGFSVTRDGVAMSDAAAGGRFLVDVDGPKKPIQAIAITAGRATLPGYSE